MKKDISYSLRKIILDENIESVENLLNIENEILDHVIKTLADLDGKLKKIHAIDSPWLSVESTIKLLTNIQNNGSYSEMFSDVKSSCLVLLISHFETSISSLFSLAVPSAIEKNINPKISTDKVKVSFEEICSNKFDIHYDIGSIIIREEQVSFQDMQSICRLFKRYFKYDIPRDIHVENIIAAQAVRHAIVHTSGRATAKTVSQVRSSATRTVLKDIIVDEYIEFSKEDVTNIISSIKSYYSNVSNAIESIIFQNTDG